jgi:ribonucleotide reductase beta subunit family protein with ferritin-like domain
MYKKQQQCNWIAEEIDFSKDYDDYLTLSKDEQQFIKLVLAFFASSDGIVNFNLRERFLSEIQITEAQIAYGFQLQMENVHSEVYADMLINIIRDPVEREYLFNAITTIPSVKRMSDWALKWIESDKSIGHRVIAFAIVEGIMFSGAFAAIFWLKKQRSSGRLFMQGLIKSNNFIARDEGLHTQFACALYSFVNKKIPEEDIIDMFKEANDISKQFVEEAIQCRLLGMSSDSMNQYINYVSDRLLVMLGYDKLYNVSNPFDFMDTIGMLSKDNFFETRPDSYQKAHNQDNKDEWVFERLEIF